jgi:septum formation protein
MSENQRPIILASGSPRRKELLAGLGLRFSVIPSNVSEEVTEQYSPAGLVEELAFRKAEAVAKEAKEGLVIGSDTIVVLNEEILGKPKDEEDAFAMLSKLQGQTHVVYSGLAIIDVDKKMDKLGHQATQVTMRAVSEAEIRQYIATKEPMDKAGAYAIQGFGSIFVEQIVGDYFSVVGLPLRLTAQYLKECGLDVLEP